MSYQRFRVLYALAGVLVAPPAIAQIRGVAQEFQKFPNDPLKSVAVPPPAVSGRIVYTVPHIVKGGPQVQPFSLVIRKISAAQAPAKQAAAPVSVLVTPPLAETVFQPQFSPDGRYVLYKVGWPYELQSSYRMFVWDLQSKKLVPTPKEKLRFMTLRWSPHSDAVAFIRGGATDGSVWEGDDPLQLCVFSLKTGKTISIVQNPGVTNFIWTSRNTLLYTTFPHAPSRDEEGGMTASQHLTVCEANPTTGASKTIVSDAYGNPNYAYLPPLAASPDGKWIAFFGWPEVATSRKSLDDVPALYLYDCETKQRHLAGAFRSLNPEANPEALRWTPDSQRLLRIQTTYKGTEAGINWDSRNHAQHSTPKGFGEVHIIAIDVATFHSTSLATIHAVDSTAIRREVATPQFDFSEVTKEGSHLFVTVDEVGQPLSHDSTLRHNAVSLRVVNLSDGNVRALCAFGGTDMDWHDDSTATSK